MQGFIRQWGVGFIKDISEKNYDGTSVVYVTLDIPQDRGEGKNFTIRHTVELRGWAIEAAGVLQKNQLVSFEGYPKVNVYLKEGQPKYSTSTVGSLTIHRGELEFFSED